ncbi:MAG: type II secretion system GspH family protein [Fimbriimonadaceae bacterium]|nr:type II secretion system GspH family protein [Fimbriimonadaceae bacterium]
MLRRAFTLIEMLAVILVVAMIAAIAMPNLASMVKSGRQRNFLQSLERMTVDAQQSAMSTRSTVTLSVQNGSLVAETGTTNTTDGRPVARLEAVEGISIDKYRLGTEEVGDGDWQVKFYADGTSDSAGLELTDASGAQWSFLIDPKKGRGHLGQGELPVDSGDKWPAGDYVAR